jgi:D-arabinose 1-dehydrogenase-like Zn-dependent alcohol dehydrogenase
MRIAERFALDDIAGAHERMERGAAHGRIVLEV